MALDSGPFLPEQLMGIETDRYCLLLTTVGMPYLLKEVYNAKSTKVRSFHCAKFHLQTFDQSFILLPGLVFHSYTCLVVAILSCKRILLSWAI